MVVTRAPGPITAVTTASDTVPTTSSVAVITDTDTVPVEVAHTVTLHQHLSLCHRHLWCTLHLHRSTILLLLVVIPHRIATASIVASNNHKKIATKSVPPVVQPVVAEVAREVKEERVVTTAVALVDTEATVERVVKVEKEEAVVSTTDMLPVKQSVNLLVLTTNPFP